MKQLYIKQKFFSLTDKFTIKDEHENDVYYVKGRFLKIPKTFSIDNMEGQQVALITKKYLVYCQNLLLKLEGSTS